MDGIRVVRVPPPGPGRTGKFLMLPAAVRAVVREAAGHDVLVVRGTRVLGLPGLVAARASGVPVVMQPETNGELSGEAWTWGKAWAGGPAGRLARGATALRNRWLRDADAFVAMSRVIRDEMLGAGVPGERIVLLPHGVDTERFSARDGRGEARAAARAGSSGGRPGRLLGAPAAGQGARDAARRLRRHRRPGARPGPGAGRLGRGSGPLDRGRAASPRRRAAASGRESPSRDGVERVEDYLRAADVFVFPSVFEALGIALVEAAACALPAVASRTGGIVDVVEDGVSGRLVAPGDAAGALRGPPRPRGGRGPALADGARGARHRPRALRRARRGRALPGPLPRGQLSTGFCIPAGTCSSCRWSSSSITGCSSLKEKYSASRMTVAKTPMKWNQR